MIIDFYIKANKLYKQDSEQTINQNATNVKFSFELTDEWIEYKPFCLVKTKEFVYRLDLKKETIDESEKYVCELPDKASSFSFIKVSLYGVSNEDRITSNELIIPIDRGGYLEYKPHHHHDHFPHHGTHHYHHDFPHHYPPVKTHHKHHHHKHEQKHDGENDEIDHKHHKHHHHNHKAPFDWNIKDKKRIYFDKIHHKHHKEDPHYELVGEAAWDKKHIDIFDFILHEIKDSINNIVIDKDKVYAYHNERLLQVIPLPDYVTKEELDYFLGDLVTDINFFENGDVIISRSAFNE